MYIYFVGCFVAYILSYYFYEYMHEDCRVFNPACHCQKIKNLKYLCHLFVSLYSWIAVVYIVVFFIVNKRGE